jgi:hypothetical protein
MPTLKYFAKCPAFPTTIPVADIPVFSFDRLQKGDEGEEEKLFDACQEYGFFLLDLKESSEGNVLLHNAEKMFDLTEATLNLDKKILDTHASNPPRDLIGYINSNYSLRITCLTMIGTNVLENYAQTMVNSTLWRSTVSVKTTY